MLNVHLSSSQQQKNKNHTIKLTYTATTLYSFHSHFHHISPYKQPFRYVSQTLLLVCGLYQIFCIWDIRTSILNNVKFRIDQQNKFGTKCGRIFDAVVLNETFYTARIYFLKPCGNVL